jgi:hypothetical protein
MPLMKDVYTGTLAAHNWSMYDITTDLAIGNVQRWDALAAQGPATEAVMGSTYLLAPNAGPDETVRDAVARQQGMGAYVRMPDINSPDYAGVRLTCSPNFVFFTRIALSEAGVRLYSYTPPSVPATDQLLMRHAAAERVFPRDFGVMTYAEFRAEYARWH